MNHSEQIATSLKVQARQVAAVIQLLDEGNTVPFIARYRKEMTGSLDDEQVRITADEIARLRTLDERRAAILKSIEEQGRLTGELREAIQSAGALTQLEDLYAPYKPKRRTRATVAREKGLEPLAMLILAQEGGSQPAEELARPYLNERVTTVEEALEGGRDIVAEIVSDNANVRQATRERALKFATLRVEKVDTVADEKRTFESYYDFSARVDRLQPHQALAIDRGEKEGVLRARVELAARDWQPAIEAEYEPNIISPMVDQLVMAVEDAADRLLLPAIERDVRRELSDKAGGHAIQVFAVNLRALLSQPPLSGHVTLGLDPGYRTGCKAAVVDATGKLLDTATIYPHEPKNDWGGALAALEEMVNRHHVTLVTIGNGAASRETERLVAELTRHRAGTVKYLIVNEAGASVYSASTLARKEFPNLDVALRGAVSIARRAQDPLAELVKIDPKSIGVGLYQHDVDQGALERSLDGVIESVVNNVGVDLNTASPALLTHVAGIGQKLADNIVTYRDEKGPFSSRLELRQVSGLGPKAFEQAAGFLRIRLGSNALDASAIHPESYPVAEALLARAGLAPSTPPGERKPALDALVDAQRLEQLAGELGCGLPTLEDILEQLVRPGRDPRRDAPPPILRSDALKMEDLAPGMILKGTVRNVVDFGAFVDIGVKQDGLLHKSQIPAGTVLKVGDIIDLEILKIEAERGRISLGWADRG
ncbi:MAG: RNA-binding transcriptional accessory protein [Chloroflexi bacterium]|nr:RNA-binding transcriptional accessory protein [Chloroflexota bacterium]